MNCEDVRAMMGPFIDEELPVEAVALINCHVADCIACDDERAALAAVRSQLQEMRSRFDPREGFEERLREGVEARRKASARLAGSNSWRYAVPLTAAAAALLLCLWPHGAPHTAVSTLLSAQQLYSYEDQLQQPSVKAVEYDPGLAPRLVGVQPQAPIFRGWQLTKTCVVAVNSTKGIKYEYSQSKNGSHLTMSCYQFRSGAFDGSDLTHHVIDGRKICCGTRDSVSLVYWSDAQRDFVLASQMPRADLMDIALQS
jgi:anti-sigma factor RsiW